MTPARGTVVLVALDPTVGREQRGTRPCVVVSDAATRAHQRYPLIAVVPLTGTPVAGAMYPQLAPGESGLTKHSTALVDHLRAIDPHRIAKLYGRVHREELESIDNALKNFLGLA